MKRIAVISPFRETAERSRAEHFATAKLLCRAAALASCAPFASHVSYPLFLDEDSEEERALGLSCEHAYLETMEEAWIWDPWGISGGMKGAIEYVEKINRDGNPSGHCAHCAHLQIKVKFFSKGEIPEWKEIGAYLQEVP